jgi:hypothetical protein
MRRRRNRSGRYYRTPGLATQVKGKWKGMTTKYGRSGVKKGKKKVLRQRQRITEEPWRLF